MGCLGRQSNAAKGPDARQSARSTPPHSRGQLPARIQPHLRKTPQINAGQLPEAVALLDGVLADSPGELSARVARGTARALLRDLKGAIEDFDAAIKAEPRWGAGRLWGQSVRVAVGHVRCVCPPARAPSMVLSTRGGTFSAPSNIPATRRARPPLKGTLTRGSGAGRRAARRATWTAP